MRENLCLAALAFAAALAACRTARSAEAEVRPRIVLLAESGDLERVRVLGSALEAQLSDFAALVETIPVDAMPGELPLQVETARRVSPGALATVWLTTAGRELFIFVSDEKSERIVVRALPKSSEGWESACDAIATVVRSALRPWLVGEAVAEPAKPVESEPAPLRAEAGRDSTPPEGAKGSAEPSGEKGAGRAPRIRAVAAVGYSPQLVDAGRGSVAHGADFGLGILIGPHVEIGAGLCAFASMAINVPQADLRFERNLAALSVTVLVELRAISLGLRLGGVLDATRVVGVPPSQAADDTSLVGVGLEPAGLVRGKITSWLALYAALGVDVFTGERRYRWNGEVALSYDRAQLRVSMGIALLLPP